MPANKINNNNKDVAVGLHEGMDGTINIKDKKESIAKRLIEKREVT